MKDTSDFEIPTCILTGKTNYEDYPWGAYHLNLADPVRVAKCKETGMLYLCPRPSKQNRYLMLNGVLPVALSEYGNNVYNYAAVDKLRTQDFIKRIDFLSKTYTSQERKLLDVGTSSGHFMELAKERGWNVFGLEPFIEDVEKCRQKGLDVELGVAEKLPYESNTFDVVHASHVYEHLEDPLVAAQEAWRVLKPGGMLFIEIPNQLDNFGFHRDILFSRVTQRKRNITSIHHLWFFGRKTLRLLLMQANFLEVNILNHHHRTFGGWRTPFSQFSKLLSNIWFGTYILRGYGYKPKV